jgi:hypothetical protein
MVKFRAFDGHRGSDRDKHPTRHGGGYVPHRRLADMPGLDRALGGRGLPFETLLAEGMEGREALRR